MWKKMNKVIGKNRSNIIFLFGSTIVLEDSLSPMFCLQRPLLHFWMSISLYNQLIDFQGVNETL